MIPLRNHTYYSILQAIQSPEELVGTCKKYSYEITGISDKNSLSGAVKFYKSAKKAGIKPILGMELSLEDAHPGKSSLLFALNLTGWKELLRVGKELPKSFQELASLPTNNLVCVSGYKDSDLDLPEGANSRVALYKELFGKRFYVGLDSTSPIISEAREFAHLHKLPTIPLSNSHYGESSDEEDMKVLICSLLNTNLKKLPAILSTEKYSHLSKYLNTDYSVISPEEASKTFLRSELLALESFVEQFEPYDILHRPQIISFSENPNQFLRELCIKGWRARIENKVQKEKQEIYRDRIRMELGVIERANLANYFLVVQDYVGAAKNRGELVGSGRGSCAGCLISYLLGITEIDPIQYGLIFERFYNEGRNTADRVALPDIDTDFMRGTRHLTIEYIKDKYGHENVAQMCTFGRMQGRAALKDVLRASGDISFEEMNEITKPIPDEAKISDELQEIRDAGEEPSIIRWTLENEPENLADYCKLEDGELTGPLSDKFAQAIRLEGVKRSQSKHASGLIISPVPINSVSPMVKDKSGTEYLVGVEMGDAEELGLVKYDILGVALLDRIDGARKLKL